MSRRSRSRRTADPLADVRRPAPPPGLVEQVLPYVFAPAPDVSAWLFETFVFDDGPLSNEDHRHLRFAHLGVLWTNVPNSARMRNSSVPSRPTIAVSTST